MKSFATIILAAGRSRRMGQDKFGLPVGGIPLVRHLQRIYEAFGSVVVCSSRGNAESIAGLVPDAEVIVNEHPEDGMFSSVKLGMAKAPQAKWVFVTPVDCPLANGSAPTALADVAATEPSAQVLVPTWEGRPGHPILLSRDGLDGAIASAPSDSVFRDVLSPFLHQSVAVLDSNVLLNMNLPGDTGFLKSITPEAPLRLRFFGHACFGLDGVPGKRVLFDPYEPHAFDGRLDYELVPEKWDVLLVSHEHRDHNFVSKTFGDPIVVRQGGDYGGVHVRAFQGRHGDAGGTMEAETRVFRVEVEGISVVHPGDLGDNPDDETVWDGFRRPDVLLLPVGGHFTMGPQKGVELAQRLRPRVVIPMHYKTDDTHLPILPLDATLESVPWPVVRKGSSVELSPGTLPDETEMWILEPLLGAQARNRRSKI